MRPCWSASLSRRESASQQCNPAWLCWVLMANVAGRLKGKSTFRLSMRFIDPEMETRYSVEKEKQSGAAFSCSCVVLFFTALVEVFIDPWYGGETLGMDCPTSHSAPQGFRSVPFWVFLGQVGGQLRDLRGGGDPAAHPHPLLTGCHLSPGESGMGSLRGWGH